MWVDRHDGVSHALDASSRSSFRRVVCRICVSFLSLPKLWSEDWVPCAVKDPGGGGEALLGKVSCYITQLGSNSCTLGSMKTVSWFWVGQPDSSAAQGFFAAARQTLRHVGESNLIWLFCISKLLFGYNLWHEVSCHKCHVAHRNLT